ncbi:undecaprenyl-diphosphate phosphatase [Amedibacillus dolichus]|uniref:Undecaprenyl-diphosphatase n=4 Tax=Amedibacillus dolichus TaxID=31971 RepID=A0A415PQP9_9FIRM|nr:undecaprenyl-diphosphate phosphatase [Amedibacillus dolichus]
MMLEILKAILYGIIEGITEWLPVSSTGHLILFEEFMPMDVSPKFWNVFLVVIQLGAILAVVLLFWNKIFPFNFTNKNRPFLKYDIWTLWFKILVACIPAAVIGLLFDEFLEEHLYKSVVVAIMLILVGIAFLWIENNNRKKTARVTRLEDISYKDAMIIGVFQLIAAIFPGTSRSGATILGGLMIGVSRGVAAEFTFFLAIPVMAGASLLKLIKYGLAFSGMELTLLAVGMVVAFIVSLLVIRFLMSYIKKHDFKIFGYYRIILGIIVLACFFTGVLSI